MGKIALVGSERASQGLAPWEDASWEIWSLGRQSRTYPRVDVSFELHELGICELVLKLSEMEPYYEWLRSRPVVFLAELDARVPQAKRLPKEDLLKEFGDFFFTSSLSWMMALAITLKPDEISIYGVDLSVGDEYTYQRPGLQYFIQEARKRGIKVSAPLESDILTPPPLYGYEGFDPLYRKFYSMRGMINMDLREAEAQKAEWERRIASLKGGLEIVGYTLRHWSDGRGKP